MTSCEVLVVIGSLKMENDCKMWRGMLSKTGNLHVRALRAGTVCDSGFNLLNMFILDTPCTAGARSAIDWSERVKNGEYIGRRCTEN